MSEAAFSLFINAGAPGTVTLSCSAGIGDEKIEVSLQVYQEIYEDEAAWSTIEESLRYKLATAILEKWKPVIRVR